MVVRWSCAVRSNDGIEFLAVFRGEFPELIGCGRRGFEEEGVESFGAVEEKLEFGVCGAESLELGGLERRCLTKNPSRDAGFEVFVWGCVKVFHGGGVPSDQ